MSNYRFNTIVSNGEADALKEMIFKRARERAQALVEDTQDNYTKATQTEVMDLARDSFVSNKNPFSQVIEPIKGEETELPKQEVGFAQRQVDEIKAQIYLRNKTSNTNIANKEVVSAMDDARSDFVKRNGFIGALEFLNSQASIALVKNKGKNFEAIV